jgi:hypothetical protein
VRKVYADAALEHLAHAAINAESEWEAGRAVRKVVPMAAARVVPVAARAMPHVAAALPRVQTAVARVTPQLTRGVTHIAGKLHQSPHTRVLLRTVPTIARRAVGSLVQRAAHGHPVTPGIAVRTLARHTAGVLQNPPHVAGIVRRSRALDRVYHHTVAPSLGIGRRIGTGVPYAGPYGPYRRRFRPYGPGFAPDATGLAPPTGGYPRYTTGVGPYAGGFPTYDPGVAPSTGGYRRYGPGLGPYAAGFGPRPSRKCGCCCGCHCGCCGRR